MALEEIKLDKYRDVICFSLLFLTFLSGELIVTDEICGFCKIRQQKLKYRELYFNEWYYRNEWTKFKYKWVSITT